MIELGHGTHVGLRRTRNEDTYHADVSLGLFLVADGMGGHQHGEVASALVRDAMVELVGAGSGLIEAVNGAGERLLAHA
ncbi:MAG: serine/threonine-protein phosphatase, partial [Dokdonella sp.]|nr:serine/threonine-protein phosphatase [Dokdonella sp.]